MLTLAEARRVLEAAQGKASELGCLELITVAVVDGGGHIVCLSRMDDRWFQADIAIAKAHSAAALRRDGAEAGLLLGSDTSWRTVPNLMAGCVAIAPGGVLLRRDSGEIDGAVGVSGSTSEQDEIIARAGAAVF